MKKVVKLTAVAVALASASSFAMAAENIGFINAAYLFQNHPERLVLAKQIDQKLKAPADKLKAEQKVINTKRAALQKEAPKLRSKTIQKREVAINKLIQGYQKDLQAFQVENQKLQDAARGKILASIQSATDKVAKTGKYTYVLGAQSVVYSVEGKDLTKQVLAVIETQKTSK